MHTQIPGGFEDEPTFAEDCITSSFVVSAVGVNGVVYRRREAEEAVEFVAAIHTHTHQPNNS